MFRTRQIIDPIISQTPQLIADGLLPPNIGQIFSCSKTVRYPPFLYTVAKKHKWAFSHYGIFMEMLIRLMLGGTPQTDWTAKVYDLYLATAAHFTEIDMSTIVSKKDVYSCMGRFVNISKYLATDLPSTEFLFEQEYCTSDGMVSGHPDLVTAGTIAVYDIKTTTKFDSPKMKNGTILQLSAYLALAREAGRNPKTIGVVLPFQQRTLEYSFECTEYDHRPFLKFLLELVKPRIYTFEDHLELETFLPIIGHHSQKIKGSVSKSLKDFYSKALPTQPCQIFMRGNRGARSVSLSDADIAESLQLVMQHGVQYFVHASYAINLCHRFGNKTKNSSNKPSEPWATDILREDLRLTSVTGGRGVVVHTGKGLHLSEQDALQEMYNSVLIALEDATEDCPLLLETPVDKGTELCGTPESLAEFYNRFTPTQKRKFKICIDTCHTFAAGYDPLEYVTLFTKLVDPNAIALFHLNDAQHPKGSCTDGHMWVGMGTIGMARMLEIIRWAADHGIPMVHE